MRKLIVGKYFSVLPISPAQIFLENWDKLHGEVWAKSCVETNFQPIQMSFDHPYEAPKLAILAWKALKMANFEA